MEMSFEKDEFRNEIVVSSNSLNLRLILSVIIQWVYYGTGIKIGLCWQTPHAQQEQEQEQEIWDMER